MSCYDSSYYEVEPSTKYLNRMCEGENCVGASDCPSLTHLGVKEPALFPVDRSLTGSHGLKSQHSESSFLRKTLLSHSWLWEKV